MARHVVGPNGKLTTIMLLNRHSIKLAPNDLFLYL